MSASSVAAMFGDFWMIVSLLCVQVVPVALIALLYVSLCKRKTDAEPAAPQGSHETNATSAERVKTIGHDDNGPMTRKETLFSQEAPAVKGAATNAAPGKAGPRARAAAPAGQGPSVGRAPDDRASKARPDKLSSSKPASKKPASDKRKYRRSPCDNVLLVAPYDDGRLPAASHFGEVMCHDISAQGIAFHAEATPTFRQMVIVLISADGAERYMASEIVRTSDVERDGRAMVLVGCRFIGRLPNETYPEGLWATRSTASC